MCFIVTLYLSLVLYNKNTDTTNHVFEQKWVFLNNISISIDAQNFNQWTYLLSPRNGVKYHKDLFNIRF